MVLISALGIGLWSDLGDAYTRHEMLFVVSSYFDIFGILIIAGEIDLTEDVGCSSNIVWPHTLCIEDDLWN